MGKFDLTVVKCPAKDLKCGSLFVRQLVIGIYKDFYVNRKTCFTVSRQSQHHSIVYYYLNELFGRGVFHIVQYYSQQEQHAGHFSNIWCFRKESHILAASTGVTCLKLKNIVI